MENQLNAPNDPMTTPTPSEGFKPLFLREIFELSPRTRHSLVLDLADGKQTGRLYAMIDAIPFLKEPDIFHDARLDLNLACRLLECCEPRHFDAFLAKVENTLQASSSRIYSKDLNERDFGPLATYFACQALEARENADMELYAEKLSRSIKITQNTILPTEGKLSLIASSTYSFLKILPQAPALFSSKFRDCCQASSNITALACALALSSGGHPALLDAYCSTAKSKERMLKFFDTSQSISLDRAAAEFCILAQASFWTANPKGASILFDLACCEGERVFGQKLSIPWALTIAMVKAANSDCTHPAFQKLHALVGDNMLVPPGQTHGHSADAFNLSLGFAKQDPSMFFLFKAVAQDLCRADRKDIRWSEMWDQTRPALFCPVEGISEIFSHAYSNLREGADAFADCKSSTNIEQHIHAMCLCRRPDLIERGLDAIGLNRAMGFPYGRKGLDSSLLMWFSHKATLPVFEAALDWFNARGALLEQAEAKAWVYKGPDTIKKGDLLADCVAQGKTDFARALLARIPDLDTKSAREVAKAMAKKTTNGDGGVALSAWEDLLLRKALEAKAAKEPPAAPRKTKSL